VEVSSLFGRKWRSVIPFSSAHDDRFRGIRG
jgi:hypothetical protein